MNVEAFVGAPAEGRRSLVVVNRSGPRPVRSVLEGVFDDQPVRLEEHRVNGDVRDLVCLLDADGEPVAASPLRAVRRAVLDVDSELYTTGSRSVEAFDLPDVLAGLAGTPFRLRGGAGLEKLLLVAVSRHVEGRALGAGTGTLRSGFQRLSRLAGSPGTRAVYDRLGASGVDTHVYGVPDRTPPDDVGVTVHGGRADVYADTWFVVHTGGAEDLALCAVETAPGVWRGRWTDDPERVAGLDRYVAAEL